MSGAPSDPQLRLSATLQYWRIPFSRMSALCLSDLTGLCVHARAHHDLGTTGHTVITQQSTGHIQYSTFNDSPHVCDLWESRRDHGARGCSPALYRGTCRRSSHCSESRGILFYWKFVYRFCLLYSPTPPGLSHPQGQRVQKFPLAQYATEWSVSRGLRYLEFENMSSVRQERNGAVQPFNEDKPTL